MWKLKKDQSPFEVVDGELAGHVFTHGFYYDKIPAAEKNRFTKMKKSPVTKAKAEGGKHA